jgi:shikimate 5-dehydrogenase
MVGIGGAATADQARLLSHQFDMVAITNPTRRWQRQYAFVDDGA